MALSPWFRFWSGQAWRQKQPVVFLAPDSSTIAWVKGRLVHAGIPVLGLDFLTPGGLRALLRGEAKPLALREDLRLLMELAAGELPENRIAQATAQDPSDFLQHCDRLEQAGWGPDAFDLPESRELAARFYARVEQSGLQTSASADRALRDVTETRLSQVMAYGFGPGQGGSLTLLRSLPQLAESVVFCLPMAGDLPDELAWRATLELLDESAQELPPGEAGPFTELANAAEFHERLGEGGSELKVALAPDIALEASLILNQVHQWRGTRTGGERIGVVFAREGLPLARETARLLTVAGIAHQDEIGRQPGRRPAQQLVDAWRVYQEKGDADSARMFFRTLRRAGYLSAEDEHAVWKQLEQAFREAMTTDIAVLRPLIRRQINGERQAEARVADQILEGWPTLPEQASFSDFSERCRPVLIALRWPERLDAWERRAAALSENLTTPIHRAQYLRWLAEVCRIPGRTRSPLGREAFAPVVLTTVERAASQSWDYLVFAGLNRGDWPAEQRDSLLLSARHCARLNVRACMDSPVGVGQQCLRPGRTWLASRADERRRFADQCALLLRNVRIDSFFTAHRDNPSEPGREQDLADWLGRLFHARHGRQPGDDELRAAAKESRTALSEPSPDGSDFPEIALAWGRRRDPALPFDEYSFGFAEPPEAPLRLSCKAWEEALKRPADSWFKHVLGVQPLQTLREQDPRSMSTGIWAHSWVKPPAKRQDFIASPDAETWGAVVERQAQLTYQRVAEAYAAAGRELPDWWRIDWSVARKQARQFAGAMARLAHPPEGVPWQALGGEWSLPGLPLKLPGFPLEGLVLTGRIDALLSDEAPEALNELPVGFWPTRAAGWIIDFKTGSDDKMSVKNLADGSGVQLALYALALHSMGSERVQMSLVKPGKDIEPQVSLDNIYKLDEPWATLRRLAFNGQFGLRQAQRSEYAFMGNYPLAHLPIKAVVVEAKWALTHPGEGGA